MKIKKRLLQLLTLVVVLTFAFSSVPIVAAEYDGNDIFVQEDIVDPRTDENQNAKNTAKDSEYPDNNNDPIIDDTDGPQNGDDHQGTEDTEDTELTEEATLLEQGILTSTLGAPVGVRGFDGEYEIDSNEETIEIIVQFKTPPAVALKLIQERGIRTSLTTSAASFEEQALSAHSTFEEQLAGILPVSGDSDSVHEMPMVEIFSEHYSLFNGVFMRVPGYMVEEIASLPVVYGVFPNEEYHISAPTTIETGATIINSQAPLPVNPNLLREARELFDIERVHNDLGYTGRGVRVAVLDTGIDHNHPEFARYLDETGKIPGWQFYPDYTPMHHHGSAVSGCVIAMAPGVELWNYRVGLSTSIGIFSPGGSSIEAIEAAHGDGMDVINMSFGSGSNHPFTPAVYASNVAVMDGVVVVTSAGNNGPDPYSQSSPATSSLAITVGAGTLGGRQTMFFGDNVAPFSSRGPVALTDHIKPDITAPGHGIYTASLNGNYLTTHGTSYSSPIIAGIAALLLEKNPGASPHEIKAMMMNTARPLATACSVYDIGAGFVRPLEALTSQTLVTVNHDVPVGSTQISPFESRQMASLSFGEIKPDKDGKIEATMPLSIRNTGSFNRTYTMGFEFTRNLNNAGTFRFNRTMLTVTAGGASLVNATLVIGDNAQPGIYEGYLHIYNGGVVVARLPFAVNVIENPDETIVSVSTEARLKEALANANTSIIELQNNITLNFAWSSQALWHLEVPEHSDIIIRSAEGSTYSLISANHYDGIRISQNAHLTLENVVLTRIEAARGRGVENFGHLTLLGGAIKGHNLTGLASEGAGVLNFGTFIMDYGEISGNTTDRKGGGVASHGRLIINGGVIRNNYAGEGGGVSAITGSTFIMNGGEISGNSANGNGGGVHIDAGASISTVLLGGKAIVKNNTLGGVIRSNFSLPDRFITLGTGVSGNGAAVPMNGMEVWVTTNTANGVFVNSGATDAHALFFRSDDSSRFVTHANGQLSLRAATFGISLNPGGNHVFPAATAGYGAQTARSITVNNTGNQPTGALTVALSGANASGFTLSTTSINSIAAGSSSSFTVRPNAMLVTGTHTATVTIRSANGNSNPITERSFTVSFTVMPLPPIESFVTRLYQNVLSRNPDAAGLKYWSDQLKRGTTGASVARGFFFSKEFIGRNVSNEEFIDILYRTLLNRPADAGGKAYWLGKMLPGYPRENIFSGFVNSKEFDSLCKQAGIVRGKYTPPPGAMARVFVTRLYRETLGRSPDQGGLDYWTNKLLKGASGSQVARGFVFSKEMKNKNLSNADYVEVLYKTLMGRNSDAGGKTYWVNRLDNGDSRQAVFNGFAKSKEFGQICKTHGIKR